MNILPLVMREMHVALRRRSTRAIWLSFGAGSMVLVIWALLSWTGNPLTAGRTIFEYLAYVAVGIILVLSIFLASDNISRERREGTIHFLFLTDLQGRDVVLGKMAATGLVPAYALVAMFPALATCQLVGGVTFPEFCRMLLGLVMALAFSLSVATAISCWCQTQRQAQFSAAGVLLLANPAMLCAWYASPKYFWHAFFWMGVVSLALVLWSCGFLSATWRREEVVPKSRTAEATRRSRPPLTQSSPVAWLMGPRIRVTPLPLLMAGLLFIAGVIFVMSPRNFAKWLFAALVMVFVCFQAVLIVRSVYAFYQDRQDGSLELLLGTKLTMEELLDGFYHAMVRRALPLLWLLTICCGLVGVLLHLAGHPNLSLVPGAMAITLWVSFMSFAWVGLFRSLMSSHPIFAMLQTFGRVVLPPLGVLLFVQFSSRPTATAVLGSWIMATFFLGAFFANESKTALQKFGRELLLRPHCDAPPEIESEWSFINWDEGHLAAPVRPAESEWSMDHASASNPSPQSQAL